MKEDQVIAIQGQGAIGPWGTSQNADTLLGKQAFISHKTLNEESWPVAALPEAEAKALEALRHNHKPYRQLDRSVLLAIRAAREALAHQSFNDADRVGVNMGSSRGATETFENYHQEFLQSGKVSPYSSPTTTLGNIASWVMADSGLNGPVLSHSITCSTAVQALANGVAWLKAGMADYFMAGGAEAPLTPFTLAQMKSLNIYTKKTKAQYPSRPLAKNPYGMVLGEGAASFLMKRVRWEDLTVSLNTPILLEAVGWGNEPLSGFTGISENGTCFQRSMQMALEEQATGFDVDLILMHAPGTVKGDQAELKAIQAVFPENRAGLFSNKWQIGHSFGASAALSLMQGIEILKQQKVPAFPYSVDLPATNLPIRKIMINAAGFGGNAGSILISRPFA